MTAAVTGKRGDQYLVDYQDGTGSIYDADEDWLWPPRSVATLSAQGCWVDPGTLPPAVRQMLADLNPAPGVPSSAGPWKPRIQQSSQCLMCLRWLRSVTAILAVNSAAFWV